MANRVHVFLEWVRVHHPYIWQIWVLHVGEEGDYCNRQKDSVRKAERVRWERRVSVVWKAIDCASTGKAVVKG